MNPNESEFVAQSKNIHADVNTVIVAAFFFPLLLLLEAQTGSRLDSMLFLN